MRPCQSSWPASAGAVSAPARKWAGVVPAEGLSAGSQPCGQLHARLGAGRGGCGGGFVTGGGGPGACAGTGGQARSCNRPRNWPRRRCTGVAGSASAHCNWPPCQASSRNCNCQAGSDCAAAGPWPGRAGGALAAVVTAAAAGTGVGAGVGAGVGVTSQAAALSMPRASRARLAAGRRNATRSIVTRRASRSICAPLKARF